MTGEPLYQIAVSTDAEAPPERLFYTLTHTLGVAPDQAWALAALATTGRAVVCIGTRGDVDRTLDSILRNVPGLAAAVEPWAGPVLVTPLDEGFTWFGLAACVLFGVTGYNLGFFCLRLVATGFGDIGGIGVCIAASIAFSLAAMHLRVRRWRRPLYWASFAVFALRIGLCYSAVAYYPGGQPVRLILGYGGLLLALTVGCVVCWAFDRPRRSPDGDRDA